MNFNMLTELSRSVFSLWVLTLCLIFIFAIILSVGQKRYRYAVFSSIPFLCAYFLWQIIFDIHLFGASKSVNESSLKLGGLAWIYWLTALVALTFSAVILLVRIIRYGKRSITPAAVKLCLDKMPCGVCCWRDSGRVLFSNICMNNLCIKLTDSPLLNGNHFYEKVSGGILSADGRVWRFTCRDFLFGGENLHEMIASDITGEYAETQALEKDKAELSRLKQKLQEYSLSIEETVRRQEILQAKVNIHDEMNRLMLSTMAAGKEDTRQLDRIFSMWDQNALLLCMQADDSAEKKAVTRVNDLAKALGINLNWLAELPPSLTEKQKDLFFTAAHEAVVNAAKHAGAENLNIDFTVNEAEICCRFTNDGKVTPGDVRFVGGLANLVMLAGEQGASVSAEADNDFSLYLHFSKNN